MSPEQENAINLLLLGKSDREVAEAVSVTHETVWRWRYEHALFLAELNRRQALWAEAHERLWTLVHAAVSVIKEAVKDGDAKVAVELLKIVKLHGEVRPSEGPTNPEAVLQQRARAQARRELGDENSRQVALRRLDDGHDDRIKARAEKLQTELRQPFCDASHGVSTNEIPEV